MATRPRLGIKVRRLRETQGLTQVEAATRLGISASYLNLIEHNQRPLTVPLLFKLGELFDVDVHAFAEADEGRLIGDLHQVFADPSLGAERVPDEEIAEVATSQPALAKAVIALYSALASARESVQALSEQLSDEAFLPATSHEMRTLLTSIRSFSEILQDHTLTKDERRRFQSIVVEESARLSAVVDTVLDIADDGQPHALIEARPLGDQVGDFLEARHNHFPALEDMAAADATRVGRRPHERTQGLADLVSRELDLKIEWEAPDGRAPDGGVRREAGTLWISATAPTPVVNFALARALGAHRCLDAIETIVAEGPTVEDRARPLLTDALAKYFAGALLMPYDAFLAQAREVEYDIDRLAGQFGVNFEQVCHRLTTLNQPGASGIPFHLLKVDIAGNIAMRMAGSGMRLPRFGGVCPKWNIHAAFATPGEILCQLAEMPDGTPYFCIARTIERSAPVSGGAPILDAIGLGCHVADAPGLVYAHRWNLDAGGIATPVGINCRICERPDCDQRAFPSLIRRPVADRPPSGSAPTAGVPSPPAR